MAALFFLGKYGRVSPRPFIFYMILWLFDCVWTQKLYAKQYVGFLIWIFFCIHNGGLVWIIYTLVAV